MAQNNEEEKQYETEFLKESHVWPNTDKNRVLKAKREQREAQELQQREELMKRRFQMEQDKQHQHLEEQKQAEIERKQKQDQERKRKEEEELRKKLVFKE